MMVKRSALLLALMASLIVTACGKKDSGPTEPQAPPPPTFSISTVNVTLADGSDGIQFFAKPDKDVRLVRVEVTDPLGNKQTVNVGGQIFVKDQVIALQPQGTAYVKVSGTWKFLFVGNVEPNGENFNVTQTVNVSA